MKATQTAKRYETRLPSADSQRTAKSSPVESRSTADLLKELRRTFPDMPLSERVAALETLRRAHIPR
jgi:hypothetical protein